MTSVSVWRAGFTRTLLALCIALTTVIPATQPALAAVPAPVAQEPATPPVGPALEQPVVQSTVQSAPQPELQPEAQTVVQTAAGDGNEIVEHWVGTGFNSEESMQGGHNPSGACWFCSFGVLERHYTVDFRVHADGTLEGTIAEEFNLSIKQTANHCQARTGQLITARILNCKSVYPNPSGSKVWHVVGKRTQTQSTGTQYMEFHSADESQRYDFGGIVSGCEEEYNGCKPYFFSGQGLTVGFRDFDSIFPPSHTFTIDTTTYGRPAVMYNQQFRTGNGYAIDGYGLHTYAWTLFEVGTRPTLNLDQELLERSVFMNNVALNNLFQAKVEWSAVGGGSTKWQVDTSSEETPVSPTSVIPRTFDVGALPVGTHPLQVYGKDTLNRSTNNEVSDLVIAPLVKLCKDLGYSVTKMGATANYKCSFRLPDPALEAEIKKMPEWFPYLGGEPFGVKETQVGVDLEVKSTGEGAIKGFGQTGFEAMGATIIGQLGITGDVVLLPSGAKIPSGSMDIALSGKVTKEKPLVEIVPQFAAAVTAVGKVSPAAGAYLQDLAKLGIEFEPKMTASPKFKNEDGGEVEWQSEEVSVGAGLKLILTLTVVENLIKLEASVGGEAQIVWLLPPDPNYFKSADAKIAANYKVQYWKFMTEGEKAYTWSYKGPGAAEAEVGSGSGAEAVEPAATPVWSLIDRSYLSQSDYAKWVGPVFTDTKPIDFALMSNIGSLAAPVLVGDSGETTLFWSQERPGAPALGADELAFVRGSEEDWSAPAAYLTNDTVADWNPHAVEMGGGVLLAWQRMDTATPGDINVDPAAFLSHTQVAVGFLAEGSSSITPVQISASGALNHRPQLGRNNNGAMVMWVSNGANALVGDGTQRDKLLFAEYNRYDETWSAPAVAVDNIPGVLDYAFASYGSQAAVLYLTDVDGNPATTTDRELYVARYQSGAWGAPVRLTNNSLTESEVELLLVNGGPRAIWRAEGQLFFLSAWDQAPVALPFAAAALGGNLRLRELEDGALVLVWTEPEAGGQQMYRSIFTPDAAYWSQPQGLDLAALGGTPAGGGAIENIAPGGDVYLGSNSSGMMIAYTEAAVGTTTKTMPAYDGSANPSTAIPGMPVLGKRTLRMAYVPLDANLSIVPADIVVTPATSQPGQTVTVNATVRNTGAYAIAGASVTLSSFAVGNPEAVTLIGAQTIPLLGGGEAQNLTWSVVRPQTADRLYLIQITLPDDSSIRESSVADNIAYVGTDGLIQGTGPTAYVGSVASPMAVISQVGPLPMPVSMPVGVRLGSPSGPLLGSATAVLPVAADQSVTVTVPVSTTALGAGRHTVYFEVDPEGTGGDWNPDNDIAGTTIVVQPDLTTMPLLAQQVGSTFNVWVRNEGNWPSIATTIGIFDRPQSLSGAVLIGSAALPALQPGEIVKVSGTVAAAAEGAEVWANGAYAMIDPENKVAEINENNNSFLLDTGGGVWQTPGGYRILLPVISK